MRRWILPKIADEDGCAGIAHLKVVHNGTGCLMRVRIVSSRAAFDEQDIFHILSLFVLG
jgi:hypothetical protein